jgi:formate-dependent nitrite reductase membrane component NrfD
MAMIQTRPYEFMVKYTPQKDWIEGHGVLIAFAFFLGGVSGGLYLASLAFDSMLGMFIAWLIALVMGMVDMAHLSKPLRFWRMLLKPKTSWIARGFLFITLFIGCAAIQLALSFWLPGTAAGTVFKVLAGILAFGVAIYSGFVVGYVGAIKLWNSAIVPILFVIAGLTGGLAVLLLTSLGEDAARGMAMANIMLVVLVIYAVFMAIYLWITTYESSAARDSVMRMLRGSIAPVFWIGVVLLGIVIPIAVLSPVSLAQEASAVAFIAAAVCAILGGLALRYVILKAGMYSPLVPAE